MTKEDNVIKGVFKEKVVFKSKIKIGDAIIYQPKHFNKLQKLMWNILLGIEIEDVNVSM